MGVEFKDLVHDGGQIGRTAEAIASEVGGSALREGQALDIAFEMYRMAKMASAAEMQEAFVSLQDTILAALTRLEESLEEDFGGEDEDSDSTEVSNDE